MGFLLSKLLPLLLYPLGLGLLLQLVALSSARHGGLQRASLWLSGTGIGLIWGLEEQAAVLTPRQLPQADAEALYLSSVALKEHIGLAVYQLRGWS